MIISLGFSNKDKLTRVDFSKGEDFGTIQFVLDWHLLNEDKLKLCRLLVTYNSYLYSHLRVPIKHYVGIYARPKQIAVKKLLEGV